MFEKVKLALGLTTSALDADIYDNIEAARAELIRSGILPEKANSDDDALITKAIKTYCQKEYFDDELSERYEESWKYQIDNLRKSNGYRAD